MEYVLGVDGGSSKTTVLIADVSGNNVARFVTGASNYKSIGKEKAIENLNKGVFGAIKDSGNKEDMHFISSCFGFAGNDSEDDLKVYKEIVFNNKLGSYLNDEKTFICNDTRIGIEAGSNNNNKIIIIAGTGANCFGVNEDGKEARASGWDYILADEGSGYMVGIKALRAVMRAYDGRSEKTLLTDTLLKNLDLDNIPDLTKWAYGGEFSKKMIGNLAKTVCVTADMGDKISRNILAEEAEEAAISVNAVAKKLELENKNFDLVIVGGLFKCEKYFKNILIGKLKEKYKKINFMPLLSEPVKGAIQIAIKNLEVSGK
jgi:N-acetylglucosamine kinase-like BadF-type ATPase